LCDAELFLFASVGSGKERVGHEAYIDLNPIRAGMVAEMKKRDGSLPALSADKFHDQNGLVFGKGPGHFGVDDLHNHIIFTEELGAQRVPADFDAGVALEVLNDGVDGRDIGFGQGIETDVGS